jgi:Ca2+-binding RTX toxin-like protein
MELPPKPGCDTLVRATDGPDVLAGTSFGDLIDGGAGDDDISGLEGDDCLIGGDGGDRLDGGGGPDLLWGFAGPDRMRVRDGTADNVRCGPGRDRARVDRKDLVHGCEKVKKPKR